MESSLRDYGPHWVTATRIAAVVGGSVLGAAASLPGFTAPPLTAAPAFAKLLTSPALRTSAVVKRPSASGLRMPS